MKTRTALLIAGAVTIPVIVIGGIGYAKNIQSKYDFAFDGVQATNVSGDGIDLSVRFLVTNNTGFTITVKQILLSIYGNGSLIGVATQQAPQIIPDKYITTVFAKVTVSKGAIGSALFDYLVDKVFGNHPSVNLSVQGKVQMQINNPLLSWFTVNTDVNENFNF